MNPTIIQALSIATLNGSMPFPEIVGKLIEQGIEYYHVDYVIKRKTFYTSQGQWQETAITYHDLPAIAENLDKVALIAAIRDSQLNHQSYYDFSCRAMQAGVQGYIAFLRGQQVTYWGRNGSQHIEWFPGANSNRL